MRLTCWEAMVRTTRPRAVIVVAMMAIADHVWAQAPGLPVMGTAPARGVTFGAMYGFPNEDASGGSAYGGSIGYGARRIGITGLVSRRETGIQSVTAGGVSISYKVIGGPLVPFAVNLQAGAAYFSNPSNPALNVAQQNSGYSTSDSFWHVPLGMGISWTFARPLVAIKPWVAPRLDVTRSNPVVGTAATNSDFGMSAGINFGLLNGLGFQVAYDRVWADAFHPSTLGVGLSFTFK